MPRFPFLALCFVAGMASAESPLDALELDVVDERERPEDAIQRMAKRPRPDDDDADPGKRTLKLDWRLGSADELPIGGLAPLPAPEEPTVLGGMEDLGHGHGQGNAFGHDKEPAGHDKPEKPDKDPPDRDKDPPDRDKDPPDQDKDDDKDSKKKGGK